MVAGEGCGTKWRGWWLGAVSLWLTISSSSVRGAARNRRNSGSGYASYSGTVCSTFNKV